MTTGASSDVAHCAQAVVLVGGEGTRLRPITSRLPKPVAPVVGRPFVGYILDNLARHHVPRAIFSAGFLAAALRETIGDGAEYGVRVSYVVEDRPLGTAGAIKNVEAELEDGCLLVFNGDVLTDVDLTEMLAFHRRSEGAATILLAAVEDPRRYGLVQLDEESRVTDFLEKPGSEYVGPGLINAGVYVLEREVLGLIPAGENFSIERGVFPRLATAGRLFGFVGRSYWRDIGTPESYLAAHFDLLECNVRSAVADEVGESYVYVSPGAEVDPGARVVPPAHIGAGATLAAGAQVGPLAVVGAGARVGEDASVVESVLQEDVEVGRGAHVERSVIVRRARIGAGTQIKHAVIGEGCRIGADNILASGICLHPETILPDCSVTFRELGGEEGR